MSGIFTAALEQERHQHATAIEKYQDESKKLLLSNEQLKKELVRLKEMMNPSICRALDFYFQLRADVTLLILVSPDPALRSEKNDVSNTVAVVKPEVACSPAIGSFDTAELRSPQELRSLTSRMVSFANPYSVPPSLHIGLTRVDIGKKQNVRVKSYASDIRKDCFNIHVDTWGGTALYGASCTWLEVEADDPDFQFGTFTTLDDHPCAKPQMLTTRLIAFPQQYSQPPKVVVWLTGFDIKRNKTWRVKAYATCITATSFTIHIDTWDDTVLFSGTASWIAYPADKANIYSGSFNTIDVRPSNPTQHMNSAYANFGTGVFSTPPRVILAINSIDISCKRNLRLEARASSVSAAGMTWHLNSWGDTNLYTAGASYIAIG